VTMRWIEFWVALGTGAIQHGAYRNAFTDNGARINDTTRGSFSVAFLASFLPTLKDTFHARISFAEGNGPNKLVCKGSAAKCSRSTGVGMWGKV
jgi:hypothetical protein